jgi:hypothetical protein
MDTARSNPPSLKRLTAIITASFLAIGLLSLSATAALAGPDSGVSVIVHDGDTETVAPGDPPTACTFHLHFQPDVEGAAISGAFDIHEGDRKGQVIVASGLFDTTGGDSRAPESGVFELANGSYTVTWDDELVRDKSFDWQEIEIVCEEATPTPTPEVTPTPTPEITPVPSGSEGPIESETPTPSGSDLPAESEGPTPGGSEAPAGSVAGVTVTPPATDVSESSTGSTSNVVLPVAILLGIAAIFMTSSMRLRRAVERRPSGRR